MKTTKQHCNINDLVSDIHREHSDICSKDDLDKIVRALFEAIKGRMARGMIVGIWKFGRFDTRIFKAKTLDTPVTRGPVEIPERLVPRWRPSDACKDAINAHDAKRRG